MNAGGFEANARIEKIVSAARGRFAEGGGANEREGKE